MLDDWNMCATNKGVMKTSEKTLSSYHCSQNKSNLTAAASLDAIPFNLVGKYQRLGG